MYNIYNNFISIFKEVKYEFTSETVSFSVVYTSRVSSIIGRVVSYLLSHR